ncbi:MAG TPA: family 43 glycosylhydrolase [Clostridiales bacterium]|nr:family 43 glycosylhydrolase [Clostridiales bacterium]
MKISEINISDPFVLPANGKYYIYGTRGATRWTAGTGFDCYVSDDLKNWSEPVEIFHKPEGFWADKSCWAPEVYLYNGAYYMFATFKDTTKFGGTAILRADTPLGPFQEHSVRQVTPEDWECLDGTFYVSPDGIPYMIFVHEWVQISDGQVCAVRLSPDLRKAVGEPFTLFSASEATGWIIPHFQKNRPGAHYVSDGPFVHRMETGRLLILWSSFGKKGYTEAIAYSDNGDITGRWSQEEKLIFEKDGGHGMIFKDYSGRLYLTLHTPNETLRERPVFYELKEEDGTLVLHNTTICSE